METLKEQVEKTIRKFYGFGSNIAVNNVDVQFNVATQQNGVLQLSPAQPTAEKRPYPKRKKPRLLMASKSLHREYTTSPEDIACMRHFFGTWKKEGILSGDMEHFIAQTTGVRYPMLSQETKTKMREYFEEMRIKKLHAKGQGVGNV